MSGRIKKVRNSTGNNSSASAGNEVDSLEFIEKTRLRLAERRRFEMVSRLKELEDQQMVTRASRSRWRDQLKGKRSELLAYFIDKKILRETIRHHPEILIANAKFANQPNSEGLLANRLKESLDKLTEDKSYDDGEKGINSNAANLDHLSSVDNHDLFAMKEDLLPLSLAGGDDGESIMNKLLISATRPSQAVQFLQNSVTFNLAVNKRMKDYRSSIESDSSGIIHSPKASLTGATDSPSSSSNTLCDDLTSKNRSSIYNQLNDQKVTSMIMSLACGAYSQSQDKSNSYSSGGDRWDPWECRRVLKTSGVMTRIMGGSSIAPTTTRDVRSLSKAVNPSAPFSSPIPSFLRRGHSNSFQNLVELAATASTSTPADLLSVQKSTVHCSLVDDAFLIGPDDQSILKLVKDRNSQKKALSAVDVHCLDPHIIYRTECDNPDMLGLLPSYCYPRYDGIHFHPCSTDISIVRIKHHIFNTHIAASVVE
jgi:hypothetical protein